MPPYTMRNRRALLRARGPRRRAAFCVVAGSVFAFLFSSRYAMRYALPYNNESRGREASCAVSGVLYTLNLKRQSFGLMVCARADGVPDSPRRAHTRQPYPQTTRNGTREGTAQCDWPTHVCLLLSPSRFPTAARASSLHARQRLVGPPRLSFGNVSGNLRTATRLA